MPLIRIDGVAAFDKAAGNHLNNWPERSEFGDRVEPITKPGFRPSFTIDPQDSVFTIGSCFARNVEAQLERLGFAVPMRAVKILDDPTIPGDANVFNNYSVPSILNELEWAVDPEKPFDPRTGLLELRAGAYCDLHLTRLLKPTSLDGALQRRARIKEGMQSVTRCRVAIVTLGLVEVWWDNQAQRYLNIAPPKQATKREPGRFELHVLSYAEIVEHLHKIVALLKRFGPPDQRIVLTVSPVPLGMTFTDQDVVVANCYSKSALRTAAQEIWHRYDHVDYYPSYESVVLSDRRQAFQADQRHVTHALIGLNVNRMIAAYTGTGAAGATLEEAEKAEATQDHLGASGIYRDILNVDPTSIRACLGLGRCLGRIQKGPEAIDVLAPLLDRPETRAEAARVIATVCRLNHLRTNFENVQPVLEEDGGHHSLRELILTGFAFGQFDRIPLYCETLRQISPRNGLSDQYLGRAAFAQEDWDGAEKHLRAALTFNQGIAAVYGLLGQLEIRKGLVAEAEATLAHGRDLNPNDPDVINGYNALRSLGGHGRLADAGRVISTMARAAFLRLSGRTAQRDPQQS